MENTHAMRGSGARNKKKSAKSSGCIVLEPGATAHNFMAIGPKGSIFQSGLGQWTLSFMEPRRLHG